LFLYLVETWKTKHNAKAIGTGITEHVKSIKSIKNARQMARRQSLCHSYATLEFTYRDK